METSRVGIVCVGFRAHGFPVFVEEITQPAVLVINEEATFTGETREIHCLRNAENKGFGHAVVQGIAYLEEFGCTHYLIINPDTSPSPEMLARLLAGMERTGADLAQPVVLCPDGSINTTGNTLSYVGISTCRELGSTVLPQEDTDILIASGACLCVTKEAWELLGGFDPHIFLYQEDTDLSWRAAMMGLRTVCVADAVCVHDYALRLPDWKLGYLEQHRLAMVFQNYETRTLWCLLPVLFFLEIGMCVSSFVGGWFGKKWAGYGWLWKHRFSLRLRRKQIQAMRKKPDRVLWKRLDQEITDPTLCRNLLVRWVLNPVLRGYGKVIAVVLG